MLGRTVCVSGCIWVLVIFGIAVGNGFFNFRSVYSSGGYVRYLGITEWVGMAESAACLTDDFENVDSVF